MLKTFAAASAAVFLSATSALANSPPTVPEIDALSGLAAIAVVGAAVALVRERSK